VDNILNKKAKEDAACLLFVQGVHGMHWPVVVAPGSLSLRIAKHEMERKEMMDAAE